MHHKLQKVKFIILIKRKKILFILDVSLDSYVDVTTKIVVKFAQCLFSIGGVWTYKMLYLRKNTRIWT